MKELKNECGRFQVDDAGVLLRFDCAYDNDAGTAPGSPLRRVFDLHIPEGVTVLQEDAFREYDVLWELTLPDSLEVLGTGHGCAFAGSRLPAVRIPETLQVLGIYAFGSCFIHDLYLPEKMPWPYARHFKSSCIAALHISRRYQDEKTAWELGAGVWSSLRQNGVKIGRFVWED